MRNTYVRPLSGICPVASSPKAFLTLAFSLCSWTGPEGLYSLPTSSPPFPYPGDSKPFLQTWATGTLQARILSLKSQNFAPSCFPSVEGCPFSPSPLEILVQVSPPPWAFLDYSNPNCSLSITIVLRTYRASQGVLCMVISNKLWSQGILLRSCICAFLSPLKQVSSVQFSRSVVSDSLQPHESQHVRPPCPSPTPGVHSDLTSIKSVMPSSHLILCRPLFLLPPIPPSR